MADKVRVVIEVSGGVVQEVYSSYPLVEVVLLDYDNEEAEAEVAAAAQQVREDVAVGYLIAVDIEDAGSY